MDRKFPRGLQSFRGLASVKIGPRQTELGRSRLRVDSQQVGNGRCRLLLRQKDEGQVVVAVVIRRIHAHNLPELFSARSRFP